MTKYFRLTTILCQMIINDVVLYLKFLCGLGRGISELKCLYWKQEDLSLNPQKPLMSQMHTARDCDTSESHEETGLDKEVEKSQKLFGLVCLGLATEIQPRCATSNMVEDKDGNLRLYSDLYTCTWALDKHTFIYTHDCRSAWTHTAHTHTQIQINKYINEVHVYK